MLVNKFGLGNASGLVCWALTGHGIGLSFFKDFGLAKWAISFDLGEVKTLGVWVQPWAWA